MQPLVTELNPNIIAEGDILCIQGTSPVAVIIQGDLEPMMVTGSPISHVAIALKSNDDRLMWFEFAERGGAFEPLSHYLFFKKGAALLGWSVPLTNTETLRIRECALSLIGTPYDALGLFGKLLHIIFGRKWLKNPLHGAGYFCSAGVEYVCRAAGRMVTFQPDVRTVEPKDIFASDALVRKA